MEPVKIIAIGDNVCDKYLSRGKMYPGGQCVNTVFTRSSTVHRLPIWVNMAVTRWQPIIANC